MNSLKSIVLLVLLVVLIGVGLTVVGAFGLVVAQTGSTLVPATKYEPTELQRLKLQVLQRDAQLAQVQLQRAQQAFQGALAALDAEAGEVKKSNKWPAEVQFSPDTLTFDVPKLPPGQPEAKKPQP